MLLGILGYMIYLGAAEQSAAEEAEVYTLEIDYTNSNIKDMINALEDYDENITIKEKSINVGGKRYATADLRVEYDGMDDEVISLEFSMDSDGEHQLKVYSALYDYNTATTVCAVAQAFELMLTGDTKVADNFEDNYKDNTTYIHDLDDSYSGICEYRTTDNAYKMVYTITTGSVPFKNYDN